MHPHALSQCMWCDVCYNSCWQCHWLPVVVQLCTGGLCKLHDTQWCAPLRWSTVCAHCTCAGVLLAKKQAPHTLQQGVSASWSHSWIFESTHLQRTLCKLLKSTHILVLVLVSHSRWPSMCRVSLVWCSLFNLHPTLFDSSCRDWCGVNHLDCFILHQSASILYHIQ